MILLYETVSPNKIQFNDFLGTFTQLIFHIWWDLQSFTLVSIDSLLII